jgi:hypothetical protein
MISTLLRLARREVGGLDGTATAWTRCTRRRLLLTVCMLASEKLRPRWKTGKMAPSQWVEPLPTC